MPDIKLFTSVSEAVKSIFGESRYVVKKELCGRRRYQRSQHAAQRLALRAFNKTERNK